MAYKRKTKDEYEVQGNYAGTWEMLTTEETYKDAREMLKCYEENEPKYLHRIIRKRVRIENVG